MHFPLVGKKLPILGVFIILMLLAEPAKACLPSPDPDHYAVLLSAADGTIIAAKAKVKAPGSEPLGPGELRAHLRYKLQSAGERQKFHYAGSRVIPVDGLNKDSSTLLEFDFVEASIPAEASHLTLKIYYQEDVDGVPLLISEYLPKQLLKETSEILIPALPPLQGSVSIWGPVTFLREHGKPKTDRVSIPISDPTGPFILRLTNGSAEGTQRVSSATIRLNGREIFKPCELNRRVAELNRQVTLLSGENLLEVKLRSAPAAQVTIELFRLEKNGCSAFEVHTFMRNHGKPIVKEEVFELSPEFTGPFTLNLFNGDLDGSSQVDSAIITLNGQKIFAPHSFNEQVEVLSQVVSLREKNVLRVELRGAPGDFLSIGITGYDHTPPKVEITRPSDAAIFTASPILVSGSVNDPTASVKVNGVAVPVASDGSFVLERVVLQDGENKIRVVAVDPCGNEGEDQILVYLKNSLEGPPLRFCAELSMPTIATTAAFEEEECRTEAYTVNVGRLSGVTDETAVSITLNGIALPDGVEVMGEGDIDYAFRDGTSFSAWVKIPQEDGIYRFTAVATNIEGARTEKIVTFLRDSIPPGIAITSPSDGWVTNNPVVTVTGTMDDPHGTVRWGWEEPPIPVVKGAFTTQITLMEEGPNTIFITAVDPIWNYSYAEIYVTLDTTPPQIEIASLADGMAVNSQNLRVAGTITDETLEAVTVAVNRGAPQNLALSGANFSGAVNLFPGANTLEFTAIDKAGNTNRVSRSVFLDIDPPIVAIISPVSGANVSGMISVSVNAEDNLTGIANVSLLVDGQMRTTLSQPPFTFSLDTAVLAMGSHTITAVGMDHAGNQAEAAITVSVSRFRIEIVSPANGATINKSHALVQGKIYNQAGEIGVVVNGILAEVNGDDFAVIIPLRIGQNLISTTATTLEGLQTMTSVVVSTEVQQETIKLTHYPDSGILKPPGYTFEVTFEAEAYLGNAVLNYAWDFDGDGVPDVTGVDPRVTVQFQTPGLIYPKVSITDSIGNVYTQTTIFNALSYEDVDGVLRSKWEWMKGKLLAGDIEGALISLGEISKPAYRELFSTLSPYLQPIVQELSDILLIEYTGRGAIFDIRTAREGMEYSFQLLFEKDINGIWRITSF